MLLTLLSLLPAVLAAERVELTVGGLEAARAVHALLRHEDGLLVLDCNDAGQEPDLRADGIWTCEPGQIPGSSARVGLLVDGRLLEAGEARWTGRSRGLSIRREGGTLSMSTQGELNLPVVNAKPAGPGRTLVLRLEGYQGEGTPVLRIQGDGGQAQLNCGDDGRFPDQERNDGVHGCAGPAPGQRLGLTLFAAGGANQALGTITIESDPVAELRIDAGRGVIDAVPFGPFDAVLLPAEKTIPGDAPDLPEPVPPDAGPPEPESSASEAPDPGSQPGGAAPGALRAPAPPSRKIPPGVLAFGLVATAVAGGLALGHQRRARQGDLPALRRLPSPPLLPGGPSIADGGCQLRCADPLALARELVPALARSRRVVVVSAVDPELPPVPGASVYASTRPRVEDLAKAARILALRQGPELVVLLIGSDALVDPGAVGADPAGELERLLPRGTFLCEIVPPEAPRSAWMPVFEISGPPWQARLQSNPGRPDQRSS